MEIKRLVTARKKYNATEWDADLRVGYDINEDNWDILCALHDVDFYYNFYLQGCTTLKMKLGTVTKAERLRHTEHNWLIYKFCINRDGVLYDYAWVFCGPVRDEDNDDPEVFGVNSVIG